MGIFSRRPLCVFCCLFLLASIFSIFLSNIWCIILACIFFILALSAFIFSFFFKKLHAKLTMLFICLLVVFCSFLNSFIFVNSPRQEAENHIGDRIVSCYIIDRTFSSETSEIYSVKIKNIDGESVNIKAEMVLSFETKLEPGDEIYGKAYISNEVSSYSQSKGHFLTVYLEDAEQCYARYTSDGKTWVQILFSDSGISILSNRLTKKIGDILTACLGEENGLLALGFFTGDRDGMPVEITRDFRRSGVSHLMAVSGSHIAILLGSIDAFLKLFRVDKKYRCITITVFSIAFLFISGFALSACRSVLMLYSVYLAFFFYDESDPLTALFTSVSLIVLFFPFSVLDMGLWMSFFATLGLLTAYPVFEERIPYPKKKNKILQMLLLMLRQCALTALMTIISNIYLLPIIWAFFGEFSIVSVLSNILISPLSSLFLLVIPIYLLLFKIPIIGYLLKIAVSFLADVIIFIVNGCSKLPSASISLKYDFCTVIIILFSISMLVLLIVKLKRKILIALPFAAAITAFACCFAVTSIFYSDPTLTYINNKANEVLIVNEGSEFSVCDVSNGSYTSYRTVLYELEESNATEIKAYVLTHCHISHVSTFEFLSKEVIVRSIYLPEPKDSDEAILGKKIWDIAKAQGVNIIFYKNGDRIEMSNEVILNPVNASYHDKGSFLAFVSENSNVIYASSYFADEEFPYDCLIKGVHGTENQADKHSEYLIPMK